jgi:hypothetical protein
MRIRRAGKLRQHFRRDKQGMLPSLRGPPLPTLFSTIHAASIRAVRHARTEETGLKVHPGHSSMILYQRRLKSDQMAMIGTKQATSSCGITGGRGQLRAPRALRPPVCCLSPLATVSRYTATDFVEATTGPGTSYRDPSTQPSRRPAVQWLPLLCDHDERGLPLISEIASPHSGQTPLTLPVRL